MRSLYTKLKPGPGQSPKEVRDSQRARIHRAMVELVAAHGYPRVTIRALVRTSEVSTRTFYKHFPDVEECFASTYRTIMQLGATGFSEAQAAIQDGEGGARAGIRVLMTSIAQNPRPARLALVDSYDGGPAMLREIESAVVAIEAQLAASRSLPVPLAQGIVAGVERVIRTKLLEGRERELPQLTDDLADWILGVKDPDAIAALQATPSRTKQLRFEGRDPGYAVFEDIGGDRGRILATTAKLGSASGYWALSLSTLRREAGVSRRALDALFADVDDCYLQATEVLVAAAVQAAVEESNPHLTWSSRLEQIVTRFCEEVSRSPVLAQLGFVGIFAPGSVGLRCRERLISHAIRLLRRLAPASRPQTHSASEAAIAASWRVVQSDLVANGAPIGREQAATMAHLILSPGAASPDSSIY